MKKNIQKNTKGLVCFLPLIVAMLLVVVPTIASADWTTGINIANNTTLPGTGPLWITFNFLLWLFKMFVILAIISFVITGIMYLFAGVHPGLQEKAKAGIAYSIIAIVIAFSGLLIMVTTVMLIFGGGFLSILGI